jgi:fructose-bisphosphate aldolase, class I
VEVGADVLKAPYIADGEALATLVQRMPVPVVLLGGPRIEDARAVLEIAANAMSAGVRGLVFGRNVFQRPNVDAMIAAMRAIVHDGATAAAAGRQLQ